MRKWRNERDDGWPACGFALYQSCEGVFYLPQSTFSQRCLISISRRAHPVPRLVSGGTVEL
jgi:hypothetical protein